MSAEHIAFDDDDTRSLRSSVRWMFAAAVANLMLLVTGFETDLVSLLVSAAIAVVSVTLFVAALRIRAMIVTDGQDQALLGRALVALQVALLVRTVWVSLVALWFLAAPFLFGGMAMFMALRL